MSKVEKSLPQNLPWPLFTNDACIIEEQPDHLVVAIRVPKETIRNNLAFLTALAERA